MTDIVKINNQALETLAALLGQTMQEAEGTAVSNDGLLRAEEYLSDALADCGLSFHTQEFDETVHRLMVIRALRMGARLPERKQRH